MRERLYNGDFFNFDFYIERTEGVYDGIDYEEAFKAFTYHILHESGPIEIGSENATCVTNASDNKIDIIRNNRSLIGYHADLVNVDSVTIDLRNENFRNLNDDRGVRI